uniref:Uncharacterized protein n=1 Tax=Meloidogyne hapla TaxID=6305 RepID=A0A1I8BFS2_MELHA
MNKKLFFLATLSFLVLLFDKGSGKIRLRASRVELDEIGDEELQTSTELPTDEQKNATDLPTPIYEPTTEKTTKDEATTTATELPTTTEEEEPKYRTRIGYAEFVGDLDGYEEEEEEDEHSSIEDSEEGDPFEKYYEGNDSVKVREAREAIELNGTTEYLPTSTDEQSSDLPTTTENKEGKEEEDEMKKLTEKKQTKDALKKLKEENNNTKLFVSFDGKRCFLTVSYNESELFKINDKGEFIHAVNGDFIYNDKPANGIDISILENLSNVKCGTQQL